MMTANKIDRNSTRADYVSALRVLAERTVNDISAVPEASLLVTRAVHGGLLSQETEDAVQAPYMNSSDNRDAGSFSKFLHEMADAIATAGDPTDTWAPQTLDSNVRGRKVAVDALRTFAQDIRANGMVPQIVAATREVVFAMLDRGLLTEEEIEPIYGRANDLLDQKGDITPEDFANTHEEIANLLATKELPVELATTSFDDFEGKGSDRALVRTYAADTLRALAPLVGVRRSAEDAAVDLDAIAHAAVNAGLLDHDLYHVTVARAVSEGAPTDFNVAALITEIAELIANGTDPVSPSVEATVQQLRVLADEMKNLSENAGTIGLEQGMQIVRNNALASGKVMQAAVRAGYITGDRVNAVREQYATSNGGSPMQVLNTLADEIEQNTANGVEQSKVA